MPFHAAPPKTGAYHLKTGASRCELSISNPQKSRRLTEFDDRLLASCRPLVNLIRAMRWGSLPEGYANLLIPERGCGGKVPWRTTKPLWVKSERYCLKHLM